MVTWDWKQFCGHGENFTLWTNSDFGHCFEQVVFQCPSHALLALASSYYIALRQSRFNGSQLYVSWTWFLILRLMCSVGLALVPLLQILLSDVLVSVKPSVADCVVCGITCLAWSLHSVYVLNLRYMHTVSLRGPLWMFLTVLLVVAAESVHTRSVIIQHVEDSAARNEAEEYSCYVFTGLLFFSLITLIPNSSRSYRSDLLAASVNYDSPDTEPITWDHIRSYGAIQTPQSQVLVAEKGVNCLSWLSFYWVQKLMIRGSEGKIENVSHIFELPSRLDTKRLEKQFDRILSGKKQETENHLDNNSQIDEASLDVEVRFRGTQKDETATPKTLFQAMHSAFGWEYYSLGILKLLADGFGFAGPLLLNLIVTFIETKQEPEYHGYLYACGLLLSTFLGTICSTQFDYNSQVKMHSGFLGWFHRDKQN